MPTPSQQLLSRTIYDVDGTTTVWNFSFAGGYIDPSHVKAYTELPNGIRTPIVVTPEMLIGEFQLQITPALPPSAGLLIIYRDTPKDLPLVDFVEGPLSEVALDTNARQAVFIAAEAQDEFASTKYQVAVEAASAAVASADQANIDANTAASAASAASSSALIASNAASDATATVAALAEPAGSALVGFQQAGAGALAANVQEQLREIVFAKDFTSIQDAFNAAAGKTLILERNAIYNITALTIPAGITLISRGAKFRKTAPSAAYGITIAGAIDADAIVLSSIGGAGDNGIRVKGSVCRIGHLEAKSDFSGSSYGIHFQSEGVDAIAALNIGKCVADKYVASVLVFNVSESRIGDVECKEYRTGLYLRDVKNTAFAKLNTAVMLPGSTGGPGQNGLLLESTLANDSLVNVSFGRVEICDSAEHGVRLGGQLRIRDVHFNSVHTLNTGAGGAGATGGSGFKALGATDGNPLLHENITIGTLLVEDCSTTGGGLGNFAGVQLENIKGFSCGTMIVQKKSNPFSSHYGISMAGVEDFDVGVWSLKDCKVHAVRIFDDATFGKRYVRRVHVGGGLLEVTSSDSPVVKYEGGGSEYKDINVSCTIRGGSAAMRSEALTAGGSYESNNWRVVYSDPLDMAGAPALQLSTSDDQFVIDFTGPYYGSYAPGASNGSFYRDPTSRVNPLRIRKGPDWVSLGADTQTVVIADDAVFTFAPNRSSGFLFVTLPSVAHYGQAWFRATSSPVGSKVAGGANFLAVSTALTGTTGTDGNVTVGVQNNMVYVENRTGGSQTVTITQQA